MRRRRLCAALLCVLLASGSMAVGPAVAQSPDDLAAVTLTLDPVGSSTVGGLAVLSPRDADTAANVLAVGAPAGAIAVIHGGTCAAIDPAPVGLVGDVGTTGQVAATIPVSFGVVADGSHVLAVHPGLDLATTIACGAIPRAAAASSSPAPGASAPPGGEAFRSATYGFSIDWNAPWRRLEATIPEGYEGVALGDGTSMLSVIGYPLDGGDATRCIRDWEGRLLGLLRDGTIADLQPVVDDQGRPIGSGDAQRALGAYRYLYKTQADPDGSVIVEQAECRRLSGSAVLEITSDIPLDAHDTARPLVDALIARIRVQAPVTTPTDGPATPAAPTAPPTEAPTPEPTRDTACEGVEPWVTGTLGRFDAVKRMAESLTSVMNAGMAAYAQTLGEYSVAVQRLQIEQQQADVPERAKDAQTAVIDMLRKVAEAYDLMSQAYGTGNMTQLQQGLAAASEAQASSTKAHSAVREVATPCGITVPAL